MTVATVAEAATLKGPLTHYQKGNTMPDKTTQIDEIRSAYENASGSWTGCDWTTDHGKTSLDLDGHTADRLRSLVSELTDDEEGECGELPQPTGGSREDWIADLQSAIDVLARTEADAVEAELAASEAMTFADNGDLSSALDEIERACSIERKYGDYPTWRSMANLILFYVELAVPRGRAGPAE
jgi:hypothetical protein